MPRRKRNSGLDDFFNVLVEMPWWVGPICAAFIFAGMRFLIPAILGNIGKGPDDPMTKVFGGTLGSISITLSPWAALLVLAIWGMAELKKRQNRRRLERQTGLDTIGQLSWREFEELVAEAFRREGYQVKVTGDAAGDGGVDVLLQRGGQVTLVQCKHWKARTVDVKIVRELRGVMVGEGASYGIVVTYGTFTSEASTFASDNHITLIGGDELVKMIQTVQRPLRSPVRATMPATPQVQLQPVSGRNPNSTPACPLCSSPMVQRTARRGAGAGNQFWGCSRYPDCRGTRPDVG